MKQKAFLMLVLLCVVAQVAWADTWDGSTRTRPSTNGSNNLGEKWFYIYNAAEFAYICEHWNEKAGYGYFPNKTFSELDYKLDVDLDMGDWSWTPLGSDSYEGSFDGQGHTIRINISGATDNYQGLFARIASTGKVHDLHVSGNIQCSTSRLVGGIAGENDGIISNCWVSADVSSNWHETWSSYKAKVGGIAGENNGTVEYCCMAGNVHNDDAHVGGLVGCNDGTVSHCTFYGSVSSTHDQDNKYVGDSGTETALYDDYNQDEYTAASGHRTYRYAIQKPYVIYISTLGEGSYVAKIDNTNVTGARSGQTITLTKTSDRELHSVIIKDADGNNVSYTGEDANQPLTITMPRRDVNVTAVFYTTNWDDNTLGTEQNPYIIDKALEWNEFATRVNNGKDFSGKYVKLAANITVENLVGIKDGATLRPFSGHFDGGGNTINCQISANEDFVAPFRYAENATFKDLTLTGSVTITGNEHSDLAGIVAYAKGTTTFTNCKVSTTLTASDDVTAGGFVGDAKNASFVNCTFDGKLLGNAYYCGGFVGFIAGYSNVLNNCLFKPSELNITATKRSTFVYQQDDNATFSNCYYTQVLGTMQGRKVYATEPTHGFYTPVTLMGNTYYWVIGTEGESGGVKTYQITEDMDVTSRIIAKGTVVLDLGEGTTLHARKGIEVSADNNANLTINGSGALTIDDCDFDKAGIGAVNVGTITINGGTINASGGHAAAGIGGDCHNTGGGSITINGGVVNAQGDYAAGIGGGFGGEKTTVCGDIVINGGQVTAIGYGGYGIGPGMIYPDREYLSGSLTLNLTNLDDFVYISKSSDVYTIQHVNSLTIAGGKTLYDEDFIAHTNDNIGTIYGKTLSIEMTQLSTDSEGTYLISNIKDWNRFCATVNAGTSYSGEKVKLTADINGVSTMAGTEGHPFKGTFDGDDHTLNVNITSAGFAAPFCKVENVTIQNLYVAGSVQTTMNSGADHTGGLIGKAAGTVSINNVRVSATVTGLNYYGGFVGHGGLSNIQMTGCVFDGTLTENAAGSTQHAGGFIGWGDNMSVKMTDCLFAGTCTISTDGSAAHNFHPVGYYSSYGNVITPELTQVYYLQAASHNRDENFGKVLSNGEKQAYNIATTDANLTTFAISGKAIEYKASNITSYEGNNGLKYGSMFYAGSGESVNLTLAHTATTEGHWFLGYGVTGGGSLNDETSDTPTLTMTDADQTISAIYANKTIPYSYGFENNNLEAEGWTRNNCPTVIYGTKLENPHNGNYAFWFENNSNPPQYLISPALYIPTNATNIKVSFYYKRDPYNYGGDSEAFKVGYSTTTNDPSSFVWQNEVSVDKKDWLHYESDAFPVHPRYVAIAFTSPYHRYITSPYICIDDISIASDYDESTMIVTDGSTRIFSGYNYGFGLKSPGTTKTFTLSNPGTADAPVSVTHTGNFGVALSATSIPAGGNITLTVTLPTVVEGDDAITISSTSQYISDFVINVSGIAKEPGKLDESLNRKSTPPGWRATGDEWQWGGHVFNTAAESDNHRLITPKVIVSEGETIYFDAIGYSVDHPEYGGVKLEYSTDGENWIEAGSATPMRKYWQTYTFSNIPAGEYYIALHAWYVILRNYYGGTLPALPTQLTATGVTSNEATIGWMPYTDETAWQVSYSTTQGAPAGGTLVNATSTSTTITGLTPQTTYYVSARIDYGNGSYGDWSEEISFNTMMVAVSADAGYSEDFEGANNWLLINSDVDNAWTLGSATNHGGSKSLYISNDGGTTYAYDITKESTVYAAKLFTFEGGDYSFAYDWKCQGIENGDYLRVFLVPVTETLTAEAEWTHSIVMPKSSIAIDGGSSKSGKDEWQNELYSVEVPAGSYYVVFRWSNAGYDMGVNPPAAIDNFAVYKTTDVEVATTFADGAYWATFYSKACGYVAPEGTQVFKVNLSGATLTMTEEPYGFVEANQGVVLKTTTPGNIKMTILPPVFLSIIGYHDNSLKGTMTSITNPGNAYVLSYKEGKGVGFEKLSDTGTIGANNAYLTYSDGAGTREFFCFGQTTKTGDEGTSSNIVMVDDADNSDAIAADAVNCTAYDLIYNVTLSGRTLIKDGYWNTLCLPFDVTLADSPLKGAEARTLSSASIEDGTLNLTFSEPVTTIAAGTPFIIKWAKDTSITDPVFEGVTIKAKASTEAIFDGIKFVGTYAPFEITAENKNNILYIGSANKIGHSANARTLRSFRAHFELTNPSAAPVRTVVVDYGEEEIVTEIISMEDGRSQMEDDSWYTLSGIRLDGKPTEKGIYLFNGKKVVVQ